MLLALSATQFVATPTAWASAVISTAVQAQRDSASNLKDLLTHQIYTDNGDSRSWVKSLDRIDIVCARTVEYVLNRRLGGEINTLYHRIVWKDIKSVELLRDSDNPKIVGRFLVRASGEYCLEWGYGNYDPKPIATGVYFDYNSAASAKSAAKAFYKTARLLGSRCKFIDKSLDFNL